MARQDIFLGTSANDGTGDSLRQAGTKINQTLVELYQHLGGDSNNLSSGVSFSSTGIIFEGSTPDAFETFMVVDNPTADQTVWVPNDTGHMVLDSATQTLANKTLTSPVLTTPSINDLSSNNTFDFVAAELSANTNINLPALTDSDTLVFQDHAATLTNKTLTGPVITDPLISTHIQDVNGANSIKITATASAVNNLVVDNAAAAGTVGLNTEGTDTNIGLSLSTKGTGYITINSALIHASESITTISQTVSLSKATTVFNSGSPITGTTLPNASTNGHTKKLINIGAGLVTINTISLPGSLTQLKIAQHGAVELTWAGSAWYSFADSDNTVTYV